MSKLKYISKNYVPKGQIEGFPLEVIDKMMERQEEQGNEFDVRVFQEQRDAGAKTGGFHWIDTEEGPSFWASVIHNKNFEVFFNEYPTKHTRVTHNYVDGREVNAFRIHPEKEECKPELRGAYKELNGEVIETPEPPSEEGQKVPQGEWVRARDFWVFGFNEDLSCDYVEGVEFLGAILDDEGNMEYFGLFMFDSGELYEWDNERDGFVASDISPDRLTHCAPYPKWPKPKVEEEIFDLVDKWNCMQNEPIPDQSVRYLMDTILDWYNKKQKA